MPPEKKSTTFASGFAEFGYKVHSIEGEERVVIGVVGVGDVTACLESLEATPGVEKADAHLRAVQVRQQGIQEGPLGDQGQRPVRSAATSSS